MSTATSAVAPKSPNSTIATDERDPFLNTSKPGSPNATIAGFASPGIPPQQQGGGESSSFSIGSENGWFSRQNLEVAAILVANLISVVGVVAVNKRVYQLGFTFPSTLMTLHFLVTWAFVVGFHKIGYFQEKRIETKQYAKLGAAQVGSVGLVNLSLMHNSVGTYQLMKFLVIFVTCIMEFGFYRKVYSMPVYLVLSGLVLSVSFATITALNFSGAGTFFGLSGALSTAYYQILNKFVQQEFSVQPLQLLHHEQPWSAMWCALFAMTTEPIGKLLDVEWTRELVGSIALSAVFAFGVNVTCYLIIGKTSPITYSVLGHLKTVSIFIVGAVFLNDNIRMTQAFWMLTAFGMILLYGKVSAMPGASFTPPQPGSSDSGSSDHSNTTVTKELPPAVRDAAADDELNLEEDEGKQQ